VRAAFGDQGYRQRKIESMVISGYAKEMLPAARCNDSRLQLKGGVVAIAAAAKLRRTVNVSMNIYG